MNQDPYGNPQQPYNQGSTNLPPVQPGAQNQPPAQAPQPQQVPVEQPQTPVQPQFAPDFPQTQVSAQNYSPYAQNSAGQVPGFSQPAQSAPNQPQNFSNFASQNSNDDTIDYLNKIAPQEQKTVNRVAVFGLIGAVIISAIVVIAIMLGSQGPSVNEMIPEIDARVETLQTVAEKSAGTRLAQTEISEANTALTSTLKSMKSKLDSLMSDRKLKVASDTKKSEESYLSDLQTKLDNAYQKGTLDRTYATSLTYELTVLRSQINKLKKTSKNSAVIEFCDESLKNIDLILKSYNEFSSTKQ